MKVAAISLALAAALCGQNALAATKCHLGKMAELPVRMDDSTPLVTVEINGTDATLIADTGAFFSLLVPESTKKFNLKVGPAPFGFELEGLTGTTDVELARAKDFSLLGLTLHNVDF